MILKIVIFKSNNIKQLEEEKQKLFRRQLELEKELSKYDCPDVKEKFNPLHIANRIIFRFNKKRMAKTNTLLLLKIFLKCFQIIPGS